MAEEVSTREPPERKATPLKNATRKRRNQIRGLINQSFNEAKSSSVLEGNV